METKETLQEIIKKANETKALQDKIIAEAEENLKKVGQKELRPEIGEAFYHIFCDGDIELQTSGKTSDEKIWNNGNGFFTKEEAEKELAKRLAIQRVRDYLIENDLLCSEEEENDMSFVKYYAYYNLYTKKVESNSIATIKIYSPFGFSKSPKFLEDCKEDLLLIFG